MKNNKFNSKKQTKTLLLLFGLAAAVILYIFLISPLMSKVAAHQQATDLMNRVDLPGTLVYSDIYEECIGNNLALFGESQRCGFTAYRIYRNSESVASETQAAKDTLRSLGFQPSRESEVTVKGSMPYYFPNRTDIAASIEYAGTGTDNGAIFGRQTIPYNNQNLYGVMIHIAY